MSIWDWSGPIEPVPASAYITLGEAGTPLLRSRRIGPAVGLDKLYFKCEFTNPSGSYKDRFAVVAIAHMLHRGQAKCLATSSGNTGAALAAYCAAAGIACEIAVVETAPADKLAQMMAYGARIYRVRGFGLDAETTAHVFAHLESRGRQDDTALQISAFRYSPLGMSGVRSLALELASQLPDGVQHVFCPAGGGGLTLAVVEGFQYLKQQAALDRVPCVHCVQPEGNDTMAGALREGRSQAQAVQCTSRISGLQVASVIDGDQVIPAVRQSGGTGHLVSDQEDWYWQQQLAVQEGVFCEPAAAVALAGAVSARKRGEIKADQVVVCLVTGSGFKDAESVQRINAQRECPLIEPEDL